MITKENTKYLTWVSTLLTIQETSKNKTSILLKSECDALLSSLLNPLEGLSVLNCENMELGGAPNFQH
jgi:hypothetical protein